MNKYYRINNYDYNFLFLDHGMTARNGTAYLVNCCSKQNGGIYCVPDLWRGGLRETHWDFRAGWLSDIEVSSDGVQSVHRLSKNTSSDSLCPGGSRSQPRSSRLWSSVSEPDPFESSKNCDMVMPSPLQIFSRDPMEGSMSFLYQEEMVDCEISDASASWYSLQPRSTRSS